MNKSCIFISFFYLFFFFFFWQRTELVAASLEFAFVWMRQSSRRGGACPYRCSPRPGAASGRPASSSRKRRSESPPRQRFSKPAPAPPKTGRSKVPHRLLQQPEEGWKRQLAFHVKKTQLIKRDEISCRKRSGMLGKCVLTAYHFLMAITSYIYSIYLQRSITELA